jgi:hypothetical protein
MTVEVTQEEHLGAAVHLLVEQNAHQPAERPLLASSGDADS